MRMIAITAQILIGVTLLWLGLNGFRHLVANLPLRCVAQQSIATIFLSRYIALLFAIQLLGSFLLMVGRWKVLALVLLGPIALNIVFFHVFIGRSSLILAVLLALLESLLIWTCRRYFRSKLTLISDGRV
jgi:putative oxidoreductase